MRLVGERRSQRILQDTQSPQARDIVILGAYALAQAVDVPGALGGGAALAEALAARAAQLADDGDVNAKACLEALGALVLWRAKACLDNIDDAGDAEPLDAGVVACAAGAPERAQTRVSWATRFPRLVAYSYPVSLASRYLRNHRSHLQSLSLP